MKSLPAKIINVYLLVLGCTTPPTLRFRNSQCINDLKLNFDQMTRTLQHLSDSPSSTSPFELTHTHFLFIHSKHLWGSWLLICRRLLIYRRLLIWHSLRTDHWGSGVSSGVGESVWNRQTDFKAEFLHA